MPLKNEVRRKWTLQMEKSEKSEFDLIKSELEATKAEKEALKKNFDTVQEFLTKLVKKVPQGKAITSMEQIAKSESLADTGLRWRTPANWSPTAQRRANCMRDVQDPENDRTQFVQKDDALRVFDA